MLLHDLFRQGGRWLPFVVALVVSALLHGALLWGLEERPVARGDRASRARGGLGFAARLEARIVPPSTQDVRVLLQPRIGVSAKVAEPAYVGTQPDIFSSSGVVKPGWGNQELGLQKYATPKSERSRFLSPEELERNAFPVSAPDLTVLSDARPVGDLLRLRVFIDEFGSVVDVQVMSVAEGDELFVTRAKEMLYATRFVPGRLKARDVPSYKDVEISLTY